MVKTRARFWWLDGQKHRFLHEKPSHEEVVAASAATRTSETAQVIPAGEERVGHFPHLGSPEAEDEAIEGGLGGTAGAIRGGA